MNFPHLAPEVTITAWPGLDFKEVLRKDAGGFFVLLEVGAESQWTFYDWPERALSGISRLRVVGTLELGGRECLEIIDCYEDMDQQVTSWGRWLGRRSDETLQFLQFEHHDAQGRGRQEDIDATPQPLRLAVGQTWQGHEIYRCGTRTRGEGDVHYGVVEGPFAVNLPVGKTACLRETWWVTGKEGRPLSMAESYVSQAGRSLYFRRFNGPGYRNYADLAGNPEREHAGTTWRLWYECLPDLAFGSAEESAPAAGAVKR